jgi:hypothetical protein
MTLVTKMRLEALVRLWVQTYPINTPRIKVLRGWCDDRSDRPGYRTVHMSGRGLDLVVIDANGHLDYSLFGSLAQHAEAASFEHVWYVPYTQDRLNPGPPPPAGKWSGDHIHVGSRY